MDSVTVGHFAIHEVAGGSADGLLGADILLAFDIDLDLPAHRITFYRARRECPDAKPPWNEPYVAVAGVGTRRNRLLVPFELDGVGGMAVLDTGAQLSSISQRMAERIGLAEDAMATDRTVMAHGAAPDQVAVHIHRFREFRVGPAVMHDAGAAGGSDSGRHGRCTGGRRLPAGQASVAVVLDAEDIRDPAGNRAMDRGDTDRGRAPAGQPICTDCTASSNSRNVGMCSLGTILRPDSTLTCGALPCRWVISTARITS